MSSTVITRVALSTAVLVASTFGDASLAVAAPHHTAAPRQQVAATFPVSADGSWLWLVLALLALLTVAIVLPLWVAHRRMD